jgi:hypothetical protein
MSLLHCTDTHLHLVYETSALAEFQSTYMHKVMSILDTWMKEPKVEEEEEEEEEVEEV